MIPFLQLDPTTLALWVNADLLRDNFEEYPFFPAALDSAILGNDAELAAIFKLIDDDKKDKAVSVLSAIWHEKRHFLDLILTNYGSFRWRQCFTITTQTPNLLQEAKQASSGRLLVPAQLYADDLACIEHGIAPSDLLKTIGKDIKSRKEIIADDNKTEKTRLGRIGVGGEPLLEALAYHFQLCSAQNVFGHEQAKLGVNLSSTDQIREDQYTWVYRALNKAGLLDIKVIEDSTAVIEDELAVCIMYAALAMRGLGQEQVAHEFYSSGSPSHRFASLVLAARDKFQEYETTARSFEDAWSFTNTLCKEIFGRGILEETWKDYELTLQLFEGHKDHIHESFYRVFKSFMKLRYELIKELETNPRNILLARSYHENTRPKLLPLPVNCSPAGHLGDVRSDCSLLFGHSLEKSNSKFAKWWWADCPQTWPPVNSQPVYALSDIAEWKGYISYGAPVGKFLESGFLSNGMLGAELEFAKTELENAGFDITLDPLFDHRDRPQTAEIYAHIQGKKKVQCDITSRYLDPSNAIIFKKTAFYSKPYHFGLILAIWSSMYGSEEDASLNFRRMWSPWIIDSTISLELPFQEFKQKVLAALGK